MKQLVALSIYIMVSLIPLNKAMAFHSDGTATCANCHVEHISQEGVLVDPSHPSGNRWLLITATPSDLCLSCHAEQNGAVFGRNPLIPPPEKGAGNFVFLLENNINDGPNGVTNPINGDAAGHNINAPSYGVTADRLFLSAPGGTYPSSELGCTSCHDPHGNSNFRFLYGAGPIIDGSATFSFPAPLAKGIDLAAGSESNNNHTAYNSGMSAWCGNCHTNYLDSHGRSFAHPTEKILEGEIIRQYDIYNGTADTAGGVAANAYLADVPFEDNAITISSTNGPTSSSRLMCLTCHRAHASSAPHAGRWDFNVTLLSQDGLNSGSYPIPNPYSNPTQTGLCYKCHPTGKN